MVRSFFFGKECLCASTRESLNLYLPSFGVTGVLRDMSLDSPGHRAPYAWITLRGAQKSGVLMLPVPLSLASRVDRGLEFSLECQTLTPALIMDFVKQTFDEHGTETPPFSPILAK